ncbi:MAG: class I SAM-dependent methyltransferase [Comamonadaceae bacterium]|nr:MAG: class I SAM-dependent methyltransferase [Comamonadaceae bacterium]
MQTRLDPKSYAEHWERESTLFDGNGIYRVLSEITPQGRVLEIGSGSGLATLALASTREVLAIDSNVHLAHTARARLSTVGVAAEVLSVDVFEPSAQSVQAIKNFAPKVLACWFIGSNADDQEKYVDASVPLRERAEKYRQSVEDALFSKGLCPPSVEWVHLANRAGMVAGAPEDFVKHELKDDYDTHVFAPNGFEVVDVQIFDWDTAGSSFKYVAAPNSDRLPSQSVAKLTSVLAKRKAP